MPFAGHDDFESCVSANAQKDDPEAYCASIKRRVEGKTSTKDEFEDISRERILKATLEYGEEIREAIRQTTITPRQKATASSSFDVLGFAPSTFTKQGFDPENPPEEYKDAIEADNFLIYGKASVERHDIENQRISVKALENALDRFFESEDAPGIISRGHADVPVGRPIKAHTLEEDTTLVIDGETYSFSAGETIRSEAKDADDDQLPELWLVSRLANDSDIAKETRYHVLTGELNGYSVTVKPKAGAIRRTENGEDILDVDLHAVTVGAGEAIKNKGSEFDVAVVKALTRVPNEAATAAATFIENIPMGDTTEWLLRKASGSDEESDETSTEEKTTEDGPSPIDTAIEKGHLTAEDAGEFRPLAAKLNTGFVKTVMGEVADGNLTKEKATEMMQQAFDEDEDEDEEDVEMEAEEEDVETEEKAETETETQEKMDVEVVEELAAAFNLDPAAVMEFLEGRGMNDGEKDDPGELKAAAIEEMVSEKVSEAVDSAVESKLEDALPDDLLTEEKLEEMAEETEEVVTKAEFEELAENLGVVQTGTPKKGGESKGPTVKESLGLNGGD